MTAGVLVNRDQRGDTAPFAVNAADKMAGALGRDHHYIDVVGRNYGFEMNAEAVRNSKNFSGVQIGLDELLIKLVLCLIGRKNVDPVSALCRLVWGDHDHAIGASLLGALTVGIEPDDDFMSAVAQILRLGMPLAAITEDRDGFALQRLGICITFVKNRYCHRAP